MEGVSLGSLYLELGLDASAFYRDLERAKAMMSKSLKDINLQVNVAVNDKSLYALNGHLSKKEAHIDRLNRKVIKPRVDFSNLDGLDKRLDSISSKANKSITISPSVDMSGLDMLERRLDRLTGRNNSIQVGTASSPITDGLDKSVDRLESVLSKGIQTKSVGANPIAAIMGMPRAAISNIAGGLVQGVTFEVSKNFGKGLSTALETSVSKSFGSTELIGEKLGGKLGSGVASSFADRVKMVGSLLEKQVERVDDRKLKQQLQGLIEDAKALPASLKMQAQSVIGQENILEEGLAVRGRASSRTQARKQPAREQAAMEWRDSINESVRVETQASARIQDAESKIAEKAKEFNRLNKEYGSLEREIERLKLSNASPQILAEVAEEFSAIGGELQNVASELSALQEIRAVSQRALVESQSKPGEARKALDAVSPKQQPKAYQQLAQNVLGDRFDLEKLPSLVVADSYLKQQKAGSIYQTARNRILVTTEMAEAVMKGTLSPEQAKILGEELAHADDFDFGSYKGIKAAESKSVIGRRVTPTQQELEMFAPELGRYSEIDRQNELNAKVKGFRGAQSYLEQQQYQSRVNRVSSLAVEGDRQSLRKKEFFGFYDLMNQVGAEKGVDTRPQSSAFIDQYKSSLEKIKSLSAKASSQAQSMGDAELAELEAEMKSAISSFNSVFDALKGEARHIAQTGKTTKQSQAIATKSQPKTNREKALDAAQMAGNVARQGMDVAAKGASNLAVLFQQIPMGGIKEGAVKTAYGLGLAAKAAYKVASVAEGVALDLIPMGRTVKGVAQHTVLPAAAFMGASALIPGVGGLGAMASHGIAGMLAPMGHAAAGSMGGAIGGALPQAFGIANAVTGSVTAAVDAAIGGAIPAIASGLTAVMGGKVMQSAIAKPLQSIPVPSSVAALPSADRKSSELALVNQKSAQISDVAKSVKQAAMDGAKKAGELTAEAVKTFQELDRKIKQVKDVYRTVEQMLKAGNVDFAESMLSDLKSKAQEARANINLFRIGEGSDTLAQGSYGSKLANRQSQLKKQEKKIEVLESRIRKMKPEESRMGAIDIDAANLRARGSDLESQNLLGFAKGVNPAQLEDLAVNTAGFLGSVAGGQHGVVGALAGDLGGALAARQAIAISKAGVSAYQGLKMQDAFNQATKLKQFKMFVSALTEHLQDAATQQAMGNNLTGDIAGFVIGNAVAAAGSMVPGVAGVPMKGAAVAMATVPKLQQLRERISQTLDQSGADTSRGQDLESANLSGIKRALSAAQIDLLKRLEMRITKIVSQIDLAGADDVSASKFREEMRSLGDLNRNVERLLKHRSEIVDEIFNSEMEKRNQELLEIGKRIQAKVDRAPDPDLVAARAISNESIIDGRNTERSNQEKMRATRRLLYKQEREGLGINPDLVRVEEPVKEAFGPGIAGNIKKMMAGINEDLKNAVLKRANQIRAESKTLLNDISTARIVAEGKGDKDQAQKLKPLEGRLKKAIATSDQLSGLSAADISSSQLQRLKQANREIAAIAEKVDKPLPPDGFAKMPEILQKVGRAANFAIAGFAGFTIVQLMQQNLMDFGKASLDAAMNLDRLKVALNFATNGKGAESLKFITDQAIAMNAPIDQAREGYKQLAAATRGTRIDSATTQNLATGINQAGAALGMSPEQQERAFNAIAQMAQKGKVQAEELRGQLSETGISFQIAADAMGVSTAELNKMLELGQVTAEEFLPKLGKQLRTEFGGAAKEAGETAQGAMNQFNNAVRTSQEGFGKIIQPAQVALLKAAASALDFAAKNAGILGIALATVAYGIGSALLPSLGTVVVSLAKMIGLTLSWAGAATVARTALMAMASSAIPILAIAAAIYAVTEAMKYVVPDDATKNMEAFNTRAIAGLDEIAKAAARARGEIEKIPQPKGGRIGKGFESLFTQNMFGEELAPSKDAAGRYTGIRSSSEEQYNKQLDAAMKATDTARSLLNDQLGKGVLKTSSGGELNIQSSVDQVKQMDSAMKSLKARKQELQGQPVVDKKAIAEVDKQIDEMGRKRAEQAEPLIQARGLVQGQLKAVDAVMKSVAEQYAANPQEAARLTKELETQKKVLEQNLNVLDSFDKQLNGAVDPVRALSMAFSKMNSDLEEMESRVNRTFNQRQLQNARQQVAGFNTNQFNSSESAVRNAQTEMDRAKALATETQQILGGLRGKLDDPVNRQAIAGLTDAAGSQISEMSTNRQIDEARAKLEDKDPRKGLLEDLKNFKQNREKLPELQTQAERSRSALQEAVQADALGKVANNTANREATINRTEAKNRGDSAIARAQLALRKASGRFSPEDMAIAGADQSAKDAAKARTTAGDRLSSVQKEIRDIELLRQTGLIGQEQYVQRIRELRTQEVQAGAAVKEAEAQRLDAQAQKLEAQQAKLKADFEFKKQLAEQEISLSATQQKAAIAGAMLNPNAGDATMAQVERSQGLVDTQADQQRIALQRQNIAEIAKLRASGALTEKEAVQQTKQAEIEIANIQAQAQQRQIAAIQAVKKSRQELIDAEFDHSKKMLDFRKEDLDFMGEQLNRQKEMASVMFEAQKVQLEGQAKFYESQIKVYDLAKSAAEELNQLKPGSIETPSEGEKKETTIAALEQVMKNLSQFTGTPMNNTRGMAIAKAQQEDNLAAIQGKILEADMAYAQQQLALDIESNLMQAENLKIQAQLLKIAADQYQMNLGREKGDLLTAKDAAIRAGDKQGLEIINNQLAKNALSAQQGGMMGANADRAIASADMNAANIIDRGQIQAQTLMQKQAFQAQEFNTNEFIRKNQQVIGLGKEGVGLNQMPLGMATVAPPSDAQMREINNVQGQLGGNTTNNILSGGFNSVSQSINNLSNSIMSLADKAGIPRSQTIINNNQGSSSGRVQRDMAMNNAQRRGL